MTRNRATCVRPAPLDCGPDCCNRKLQPQLIHHLADGGEGRTTTLAQGLVKTRARDTSGFRDFRHSACAGSMANTFEKKRNAAFVQAGFKIFSDCLFVLQVLGNVEFHEFDAHSNASISSASLLPPTSGPA